MYHISLRIAYSDTSIRKRLSNFYFEQPHFRADNCSFVYTCPSRRFELKEWDRVWTERQASALSRSEACMMLMEFEQGSGYKRVLKSELRTRQTPAQSQPPCQQKKSAECQETKQVTPRENWERWARKQGGIGSVQSCLNSLYGLYCFSPKAAPTCLFQEQQFYQFNTSNLQRAPCGPYDS